MRREAGYFDLEQASGVSAEETVFVLRLQANEDAASDELVRTFHTSLYQVAYRMLGDSGEASDAVQEIFLKVFRHIGNFRGDSALRTWIFRVAFSELLNRIRWWKRRRRYSTVSLDHDYSTSGMRTAPIQLKDVRPTPDQQLESLEQEAAVQRALARLSADHRSILVLRDIEGFSYSEIADVLGVSIGTVKSRLARARADMKKELIRFLSVYGDKL
jgi:RNA polymerase sigma-70 factor (ECF subfamily)